MVCGAQGHGQDLPASHTVESKCENGRGIACLTLNRGTPSLAVPWGSLGYTHRRNPNQAQPRLEQPLSGIVKAGGLGGGGAGLLFLREEGAEGRKAMPSLKDTEQGT